MSMMMTALSGEEAAKRPVVVSTPPPPPPTGINVTISATTLLTSDTRMGWTSVHNQTRNSTTKAIIGATCTIQNQHLVGFGSNTNPQPGAGAAYVWTFMDSTFGFPTSSSGYFSTADERCLTLCGCPPHMRVPKVAGLWDPQGTKSGSQLTSLSDYSPPNSAWFQEYADLCAAAAARYPHIKYFQVWNELKGFYVSTKYPGSNWVPPGSGLPSGPSTANRWWYEGYTAMYNKIYAAIKAVRPDAFIVGPYGVLNSLSWDQATDWANDAFPYNYMGPWGYGDKKVINTMMYWVENCVGAQALCMDIRNLTKDSGSTAFYNPSVPAAPDPSNHWFDNPEAGVNPRMWLEGVNGSWNQGQKQVDFVTWLRALGASDVKYQRAVCDARTIPICWGEWYAYPNSPEFRNPNPATGNYYTHATSTHAEEVAAFAWQFIWSVLTKSYYTMAWKPEGSLQGNVTDYAESNPLGIYIQGSAPSNALGTTELYTMMVQLKAAFPAGTVIKTLTFNSLPLMWGLASPTKLMLVSRSASTTNFQIVDPNLANPYNATLAPWEVKFFDR